MKRYALIKDEKIVNVIVAEDDFVEKAKEYLSQFDEVIEADEGKPTYRLGVNWEKRGDKFVESDGDQEFDADPSLVVAVQK